MVAKTLGVGRNATRQDDLLAPKFLEVKANYRTTPGS